MNKNVKKGLLIGGIVLDVGITVFLLVVSIIMLATMPKNSIEMSEAIEKNGPFIGYLQQNPTVYLFTCVVPLFLLLGLNIVGLVMYIKKAGKTKATLAELSDEQKDALKAELLKDLTESKKEEK
ncbi:MAG: hypothetical protein MR775_04465 [Erysipelotrichaceae bacterium]|nr:hypothetical protein [Erysipelotrichaceae bacterium]